MKWILAVIALMPALALAAGADTAHVQRPPSFGLSGNVVGHSSSGDEDGTTNETRRLLDEQAHSEAPEQSELSAPVYVQTQQRLKRSFDKDIPEFGKEQTRGDTQ